LTRGTRPWAARAKLGGPHVEELDQLDRPEERIRDRGTVLEPDGGHQLPVDLGDQQRLIGHGGAVALSQSPEGCHVARPGQAQHDRPGTVHARLRS
jgi:hypothetical protein